MKFKIDLTIDKRLDITHHKQMLLLGSCFAEEIGKKLQADAFSVTINPRGVLFNPISILNALTDFMQPTLNVEEHIDFADNKYVAFSHHGSFAASDELTLKNKLIASNDLGKKALAQSDVVILTWGSSWVYEYISKSMVVANCHKLNAAYFSKRMLSVDEISQAYIPIVRALLKQGKQVVFTISPVKYLRDGVHENNLSKSVLFLAMHEIIKQCEGAVYFPAYELIQDELRDYRFYKEDLAHPNELGINYVYERLIDTQTDSTTRAILKDIRSYVSMENHRLLTDDAIEVARFHEKKNALLVALKNRYQHLKL